MDAGAFFLDAKFRWPDLPTSRPEGPERAGSAPVVGMPVAPRLPAAGQVVQPAIVLAVASSSDENQVVTERAPEVEVFTASKSSLGKVLFAELDKGLVMIEWARKGVTGLYTAGVAGCRCLHFASGTHIALVHTSLTGEFLDNAVRGWHKAFAEKSEEPPFAVTVLHCPQARRLEIESNTAPLSDLLEEEAMDAAELGAAMQAWRHLQKIGADAGAQRRGAIQAMVAEQTRRIEAWAKGHGLRCVPMTEDAVIARSDGQFVHVGSHVLLRAV